MAKRRLPTSKDILNQDVCVALFFPGEENDERLVAEEREVLTQDFSVLLIRWECGLFHTSLVDLQDSAMRDVRRIVA